MDHLAVLERKGAAFVDAVATGDLGADVPCCPGWTLRDLAAHQGHVWAWARSCIEAGEYVEESEEPIPDEDLVPWLREQRDALLAILRATDPAQPTWTFGPKPRTVAFWHRRQLQEVTVHLWDAQSAQGSPEAIEDDVAADGVAEVFEVFLPRQVRRERMAPVQDGVRIVLPDGTAFDLGANPVAQVTGTPSDLLLALWHRVPVDALAVSGDAEVVADAFDRALTP